MASGSLSSASLVHPFGASSSSTVVETSSSGSSSVTPPPSGLLEPAVSHPLLSHHLIMKNERHQTHHPRLYQPYNHLSLHHHHPHHHHLQQHQPHQQQHLLENHYDMGQHYPIASTSHAAGIAGAESRCSSVSSSGGNDHHTLTLKSEQPQSSSMETSSLELLENANVSLSIIFNS